MPARHRRRSTNRWKPVITGLDGARRYAWYRAYSAEEAAGQLERLCDVYRDRIDILVAELLGLTDAVLYERNPDAFARAWHIRSVVDDFTRGRPA